MATMNVKGKLVFNRTKAAYSDELIKAAKDENLALPKIPEALSDEALAELRIATSILKGPWFQDNAGRGRADFSSTHIGANDSLGTKDSFEKALTEVLNIVSEDGCVANGKFILEGGEHGDIERWTVTDNLVSKEKIILTWADGEVYSYHKPYRSW